MNKPTFAALAGTALTLLASMSLAVDSTDPTMHEIYLAARSGHIEEAKTMIGRVLVDHPKSAKAHYTAAEVYARTCERERARQELRSAETLQPELKFVTPRSVQELRTLLSQPLPPKCGESKT